MGVKKIVPQFPDHGFFLLAVLGGSGQFRLHPFKGRLLLGADQFRFRTEAERGVGDEEGVPDVL
ncbi:MAG: hypothetical protein EGS44_05920, partial [Akkermansia muciniphila]|nr:hypothetical protein [Akkermansia muciniphila]